MSIRLGTNPIAWSNDDVRTLGAHIPLEQCLSEARKAGFTGIELGHKFPIDNAALTKVLGAHDIKLVSGWYSGSLLVQDAAAEKKAIQSHIDRLNSQGCSVLIFAETSNAIHGDITAPLSKSPVISADEMKRFGERVTEVAAYVNSQGLKFAYHHHMGTIVESGEEIDAYMAATGPEAGLLLDTGHATFGGSDPLALAKRYKDRITHIHCKDVRKDVMVKARAEDLSFLKAVIAGVFTVPGDGMVDYVPVLKVAAEAGYEGWLVVEAEQDPEIANPLKYATMGHDNLARFAREAGFTVVG
jgi:myo-inosose-2 dehydratase